MAIIRLTLEHLQDIKIVNARSEISFLQIVPNVSHAVEYAIKRGLKYKNWRRQSVRLDYGRSAAVLRHAEDSVLCSCDRMCKN
jgi:hypothetical protein